MKPSTRKIKKVDGANVQTETTKKISVNLNASKSEIIRLYVLERKVKFPMYALTDFIIEAVDDLIQKKKLK